MHDASCAFHCCYGGCSGSIVDSVLSVHGWVLHLLVTVRYRGGSCCNYCILAIDVRLAVRVTSLRIRDVGTDGSRLLSFRSRIIKHVLAKVVLGTV